jgi:hypothetical protein
VSQWRGIVWCVIRNAQRRPPLVWVTSTIRVWARVACPHWPLQLVHNGDPSIDVVYVRALSPANRDVAARASRGNVPSQLGSRCKVAGGSSHWGCWCGIVSAGLKKSAAAKKKPAVKATAAAGFKVVDGTVVAERAHDAVDADVAAEVERELGNEAFRDQVRWLETEVGNWALAPVASPLEVVD